MMLLNYSLWKLQHQEGDVTEMKCIPQIRYMAINKWLQLQNCTWFVSMWFQYGVKPPCTAIRVSASWHKIKDIFLGNVPPRSLYASPQSAKGRYWRTLTYKSSTNHIPDMFNGRHIWRTCRPGKQWYPSPLIEPCTILATCGWALSCWNIASGVAWRRGSTSGCKTSLM